MTSIVKLPRRYPIFPAGPSGRFAKPGVGGEAHPEAARSPLPRNEGPPRGRSWILSAIEPLPVPKWKRAMDLSLILLLLPMVLGVVAILYGWIQLVSPGRFIFRQKRIGRGGKAFTLFKLRTMKPGPSVTAVHEARVMGLISANQPLTKLDFLGDSRLIKGGWLIRMAGLDELPQLINVVRGEMSLVGPRPCLPVEFPFHDPADHRRFALQPGLTGLWQVQRDETTTFRDMVGMDVAYADGLSAWLDFKIVLKTPTALIAQVIACARARIRRSKRADPDPSPAGLCVCSEVGAES